MKFNYFMEHTYDPAQQCLTFHLDYDRKSDLDDSVGYWYVQPTSPDACRKPSISFADSESGTMLSVSSPRSLC